MVAIPGHHCAEVFRRPLDDAGYRACSDCLLAFSASRPLREVQSPPLVRARIHVPYLRDVVFPSSFLAELGRLLTYAQRLLSPSAQAIFRGVPCEQLQTPPFVIWRNDHLSV